MGANVAVLEVLTGAGVAFFILWALAIISAWERRARRRSRLKSRRMTEDFPNPARVESMKG